MKSLFLLCLLILLFNSCGKENEDTPINVIHPSTDRTEDLACSNTRYGVSCVNTRVNCFQYYDRVYTMRCEIKGH